MTILKIGGSLITDRTKREPCPNTKNIKRISNEIARANVKNLIVVHGVGSYGHPIVKQHGLHKGVKNKKQQKALMKTLVQVKDLNGIFVRELKNCGIKTSTIHLSCFAKAKEGRLVQFPIKQTKDIIKNGDVPVFYGTAVFDETKGYSIISGDQILSYLAKKLKPEMTIHATNVDGILKPDSKLIRNVRDLDSIKRYINGSSFIDVTGGMLNKVKDLLKYKIKSRIINGNTSGNIYKVLKENAEIGTLIS